MHAGKMKYIVLGILWRKQIFGFSKNNELLETVVGSISNIEYWMNEDEVMG